MLTRKDAHQMIDDAIGDKLYGSIELKFQKGKIVLARITETVIGEENANEQRPNTNL